MMETLGGRQQDLLRLLLENKAGMTVDELSRRVADHAQRGAPASGR
ncbi:MAG: hypothetical protein MZW92_15440 [Comamonadaceae bacterium]|nr:hypothetical protein [Comamonadaceae bacterium]